MGFGDTGMPYYVGVSEIYFRGTLFGGPYNKDPTICPSPYKVVGCDYDLVFGRVWGYRQIVAGIARRQTDLCEGEPTGPVV